MTQEIRGAGVGLRSAHLPHILENRPPTPWFEVLIDNYLSQAPVLMERLDRVARNYPLTFHSVGMNLGSVDGPDLEMLSSLKALVDRYQPATISDHVCFSAVDGIQHHDLLPLPYTKEALAQFVENTTKAQEFLGQNILVENPSSYLSFNHSEMSEWEFFGSIASQSGCRLLLDVNNVYVSGKNHGFCPQEFIDGIPADSVSQYHLAGYEDMDNHLIDSHSRPVADEVWDLFSYTTKKIGPMPTLIEWDSNLPTWDDLWSEAKNAQKILLEAE